MYKIIYLTICLLLANVFISCNVEDIIPNFENISKNTDNSLTIIYNGNMTNVLNYPYSFISIVLLFRDDDDIQFILEVGEGALLQYEGNNLTLVNNQYSDNRKIVNDDGEYTFTVIAQNGDKATYTINLWLQQRGSKEIVSFIIYNKMSYIKMDINTNSQIISKTVTNVEGITNLISHIDHSGSNISPPSGVVQDFSTNNVYTVTAVDMSKTNYKVTLTNYYKVTIKTNGGNITLAPVITEYILYGEKASRPLILSQEHYGFKGWYSSSSGGNIFDFSTGITTQTIVYAQWTNKQYRVRFYRGANLLKTVSVASLTAIPVLDYPISSTVGQVYEWYKDSGLAQAYDNNSPVTGTLDLHADEVKSFESIINVGSIPFDLANYDNMSKLIFSNYTAGVVVVPRYVKKDGIGDGTSWDNATGDIREALNGVVDAAHNKVYVVLVASGHYQPTMSYALKNHVALVGGFIAGSYDRVGETHLDGNEQRRLFYHNELGLNSKAVLYGVVIKNGLANKGDGINQGGGMYNKSSSPTLIEVTFLNNTCNVYGLNQGGGMYNKSSSPTLIKVIFSGNKAGGPEGNGGGMYNEGGSSPFMNEVDFINNIASRGGGMYNEKASPNLLKVSFMGNITGQKTYPDGRGGGMYNNNNSTPTLRNVTFIDNISAYGGGMYNFSSSPILNDVTFSGNVAHDHGGGMRNNQSSPILNDVTFLDNKAFYGGGMYNGDSSPTLADVDFLGNKAVGVFSIGGGMLNFSSSPTLTDVNFSDNTAGERGGGMYNGNSSPTLTNVGFSGNKAIEHGGGMYNQESSPTLTDVDFSDNTADRYGGGMLNGKSSPTLTNVGFSGNKAIEHGGGMHNQESSPTLTDVDFSDNTADQYGGGMFNYKSSPTLTDIDFSGNTADFGGGMHNHQESSPTLMNVIFSDNKAIKVGGGMYNEESSPTLTDVDFSDNTADFGGGILNYKSSPTLTDIDFSGNTAGDRGGGMYNFDLSSPILTNVTFSGNTANNNGGGMYNYSSSSPTLMNVTFSGNTANNNGGGMYNYSSSSPTLMNVTFSGNEVSEGGGGMYNHNSSSTLINVTLSGNTANNNGGGIYHDGDGKHLTLINTILWNNDNGNIFLGNDNSDTETVNLYYLLFKGGVIPSTSASGIRLYSNDTTTNPININSEAVIVDDPLLGGLADNGGGIDTISIGGSSPAKDKGVYVRGVKSGTGNPYPEANLYYSINNTDWYSDPGLDTSGTPPNDAEDLTTIDARGYGRVGRPDMGAYEEGGIEP